MSPEENGPPQHRNTNGHIRLSSQELVKKKGGPISPSHRQVLLSLALLNVALLIVAVIIGIKCAKVKDLQIPFSDEQNLLVQLNFYRNRSNDIAKTQISDTLVKQRADHLHLKLELEQKKIRADGILARVEALREEKANLEYNQTVMDENCGRCPKGWIFLESSCYYFSLHVTDLKKNWPDSRADCISRGSDLLIIDQQDEQMTLIENIQRFVPINTGVLPQKRFWIGLSYNESQETWMWINNVTVRNMYLSPLHQDHFCGAYSFLDAMELWERGNCKNELLSWICEMEPKSFSTHTK